MQPNQQNQNDGQPSQNGSLPYQVPSYLQLDPMPSEGVLAKKRNKNRIILLLISIVVLVVAAGVAAYLYSRQDTPHVKLYRALDNQMQVSYVKKDITFEAEDSYVKTAVSTDASDPIQTKSNLEIETKIGSSKESNVQSVVLDTKEYIFSIKTMKGTAVDDLQKNQWYRKAFNSAGRDDVGYWIDGSYSPLVLNSVQGLIPTGNIPKDQRNQLLDFMKSNDVYTIIDTQTKVEDGEQLTGYRVKVGIDSINALNGKLVEVVGLNQVFTAQKPYPAYQDFILWVNDKSNRFQSVTYNSGENKDNISTKQTIKYTYPTSLSLLDPKDVKDLPL